MTTLQSNCKMETQWQKEHMVMIQYLVHIFNTFSQDITIGYTTTVPFLGNKKWNEFLSIHVTI